MNSFLNFYTNGLQDYVTDEKEYNFLCKQFTKNVSEIENDTYLK